MKMLRPIFDTPKWGFTANKNAEDVAHVSCQVRVHGLDRNVRKIVTVNVPAAYFTFEAEVLTASTEMLRRRGAFFAILPFTTTRGATQWLLLLRAKPVEGNAITVAKLWVYKTAPKWIN